MEMLTLDALCVSYRGQDTGGVTPALDGVSLHLAPGERVGLVGQSGSGKSTLALAVLGLLDRQDAVLSGRITWAGEDLTADPARHRRLLGRGIAYVPQDAAAALNPFLRCGLQVAEAVDWRGQRAGTAEREERVFTLLRRVGFAHPAVVARSYPHQLSGGECQRLALAAAIAGDPALLVADEPTSALDAVNQAQVLALIGTLPQAAGMALLLISHDLTVVASLCTRVLVLEDGRLVESGPVAAVLAHPQHEETRRLVHAAACRGYAPAAGRPVVLAGVGVS